MEVRPLVVVALIGCGRLNFQRIESDAGDEPLLDLDAFESLSIGGPLLDSPDPASGDCGQWLMFYTPDSTTVTQEHMPFAFVDPDGATLWFSYSCKYADTGWSETIGRWIPPDGVFERFDARPAVAAFNAFVEYQDIMPDGISAGSLRQLRFAFGSDGKVHGIGSRFDGVSVFHVVPVAAADPRQLAPGSYDLSSLTVFDPPTRPWFTQTGLGRELLRVGVTYYIYSVHWDGVAKTATGDELTSIGLATSTDLRGQTFRPNPLATGWTDPMVSEYGGVYHMVARDLSTSSYSYIRGSAPDTFDFAGAVPLGLASRGGQPGAWDSVDYAGHTPSGDPRVATARVVDGFLYVFYLAGVPHHQETTAIPGARSAMGVFRIPVGI